MIKRLFGAFVLLMTLNSFALTLDEKIGQMIIVGFKGDNINNTRKIQKQIQKGEISGVILFNKNLKSKEDLIKMNEKFLSLNKVTPFIAIDNEGGMIQRHDYFSNLSAKETSQLKEDEAQKEYEKMADSLKELKFNTNFAPVVDLELNKKSIISIKKRSYSDNPKIVSKYAKIFIDEHNKKNIITSIKHFPGHGSIDVDTHLSFADATNTFKKEELEPYYDLKNYDKLNTVMVSHIFNSKFDNKYPAGLSKKTIDYLKNDVGFKGVIISDDMDMGAIKNNYILDETLRLSINSGVNVLIFSNNIKFYDRNIVKKIHKSIKKQVKSGEIDIENIDASCEKILELKKNIAM